MYKYHIMIFLKIEGSGGFEPPSMDLQSTTLPLGQLAICDSDRTRTYNLHFRRVLLYPVELQNHIVLYYTNLGFLLGCDYK